MFEYKTRAGEHFLLRSIEAISWPGAYRVVLAGSFGDIFMGLAILSELPEQRAVNTHVFVEKRYKDLVHIFPLRVKSVSLVNEIVMQRLKQAFNPALVGESGALTVLLPTLYPLVPELICSLRVNLLDVFRQILDLPHRPLIRPELNDRALARTEELLQQAGIERGRTLVISPFNNTQPEVSLSIWIAIAQQVEAKGVPVVFNTTRPHLMQEREVSGSFKSVKLPPECAVSFVDEAGFHLSGINGLATTLALFRRKASVMAVIFCDGNGNVSKPDGNVQSAASVSQVNMLGRDLVDKPTWHEFVLSSDDQCSLLYKAVIAMMGTRTDDFCRD